MVKLILLTLTGLICIVLLKNLKPEFALLLKIGVLLFVLFYLLDGVRQATQELLGLAQTSGLDFSLLKLLLKALGVCITAQLAANVCKDCGENALATGMEMAGRIAVLIMSLPIATELIKISLGWMQT